MKNMLLWDNLTSPQIEAAARRDPIVIIPVGSVEQHGPHLPVGCDYILASAMAVRIAKEMAARGVEALVAPAIMVGNSVHHMSFAGTITLEPATFMQTLLEQCRCIKRHGFRKIALINGHGGNTAPIETAQITINTELGLHVYSMGYWNGGGDIEQRTLERQSGMVHACECETSLMLAVDESLVDPVYRQTQGGEKYFAASDYKNPLHTFRRMEETAENGVMGYPCAATKEKGESMIAAMVTGGADALCDTALWEN